jgi:hypothetical protein
MKAFAFVIAGCLLGASATQAGILKMSCSKPVCPCSSYGPCGGYFPTQWHRWPCANPAPVPAPTALGMPTPMTVSQTPIQTPIMVPTAGPVQPVQQVWRVAQ